jgi:uncharacterized protein
MLPGSLLVKPVSASCNLSCDYCFYLQKSQLYPSRPKRMSFAVLEEMISQYLGISTGRAAFSWQGGEPLLAGLDFYERAVKYQEKHSRGHVVSNAFQTNGSRLSPAWAAFFKEYKFLVGISLDGPRELHEVYRQTKGGRPTFNGVMRGVQLLKDGDVDFNVLSVVNDVTVHRGEEIYEFFASQGIKFLQFVPCLEWDDARNGPAPPFSVGAEAYGEFLCKIFDLWKRDFPDVYVRMFNSVLATRLGLGHGICTLGPVCAEYVVVEHNGDVYPCDFFVQEDTLLGNIMEIPLRRIVEATDLMDFSRAKSRLPVECKDCQWLDLCFGGCQYHRRLAQRTYFCSSYRKFFEHSEEGFRELESQV